MSPLLDKLRELGYAVNAAAPRINHGGCAVYAAAVAERLQELGVEVEVCVSEGYVANTVAEARENLSNNGLQPHGANARDWEAAGLYFLHVGVRLCVDGSWYVHDTDATWEGRDELGVDAYSDSDSPRYTVLPDGLTPEEAKAIADDARGWNSSFNRELIPKVRELVRTHL
jgi:hypothetical protein